MPEISGNGDRKVQRSQRLALAATRAQNGERIRPQPAQATDYLSPEELVRMSSRTPGPCWQYPLALTLPVIQGDLAPRASSVLSGPDALEGWGFRSSALMVRSSFERLSLES